MIEDRKGEDRRSQSQDRRAEDRRRGDRRAHRNAYVCQVRPRNNPKLLQTVTIEAPTPDDAIAQLHASGYLVVGIEESKDDSAVITDVSKVVTSDPHSPPVYLRPESKQILEKLIEREVKKESLSQKILKGFSKQSPILPKAQEAKTQDSLLEKIKNFDLVALMSSGVSLDDKVNLLVQLVALLNAGVPLMGAIQIIKDGQKSLRFKEVLGDVIDRLAQGQNLSSSFSHHPKVFNKIWFNLISVGEASGRMAEVLEELRQFEEQTREFKKRVTSAMIYPAILITFSLGVMTILMLKVIPTFEKLFLQFKVTLPVLTTVVIALSKFMRHYAPFAFVFIVVISLTYHVCRKQLPAFRMADARFKLNLPMIGPLVLYFSIVRFARGLGMLLKSGVPILKSLEISAQLVGNAYIQQAISSAREGVQKGEMLSTHLKKAKYFPVLMTQLTMVGEESGSLGDNLEMIAKFYEERLNTFLIRFTVALEPLLLVVIGGFVGMVVVAIVLPIFKLSTSVH